MEPGRLAVYGTLTVVVVLTLLSGPIVEPIDFTDDSGGITDDFGNGSADVAVVSFPDSVTLSEGRYGSGQYYLRVPDATYSLSNVTGQPSIVYSLELDGPDKYYTTSQTEFVTDANAGQRRIRIGETVFDRDELRSDRYNATVTLLVRGGSEETVLRERTYDVEVES